MPGAFNAGVDEDTGEPIDPFSAEEMVAFSTYMVGALKKAGIPHAVNSDTKFYDRRYNT